jgi:hypothetical protein
LQAPSLIPVQHRRAEQEMQRFSPSRRGTAVPGLQQLPSLDSLMTSKSVDGLSELARAPDSPPTGKTLEHFKERVCCIATSERVKKKITGFRSFVFNRVQLIHRRVPNNLCNLREESCSQAIDELSPKSPSALRKPHEYRGNSDFEFSDKERRTETSECGATERVAVENSRGTAIYAAREILQFFGFRRFSELSLFLNSSSKWFPQMSRRPAGGDTPLPPYISR